MILACVALGEVVFLKKCYLLFTPALFFECEVGGKVLTSIVEVAISGVKCNFRSSWNWHLKTQQSSQRSTSRPWIFTGTIVHITWTSILITEGFLTVRTKIRTWSHLSRMRLVERRGTTKNKDTSSCKLYLSWGGAQILYRFIPACRTQKIWFGPLFSGSYGKIFSSLKIDLM